MKTVRWDAQIRADDRTPSSHFPIIRDIKFLMSNIHHPREVQRCSSPIWAKHISSCAARTQVRPARVLHSLFSFSSYKTLNASDIQNEDYFSEFSFINWEENILCAHHDKIRIAWRWVWNWNGKSTQQKVDSAHESICKSLFAGTLKMQTTLDLVVIFISNIVLFLLIFRNVFPFPFCCCYCCWCLDDFLTLWISASCCWWSSDSSFTPSSLPLSDHISLLPFYEWKSFSDVTEKIDFACFFFNAPLSEAEEVNVDDIRRPNSTQNDNNTPPCVRRSPRVWDMKNLHREEVTCVA